VAELLYLINSPQSDLLDPLHNHDGKGSIDPLAVFIVVESADVAVRNGRDLEVEG
jgi:hypothetical protein